LTAGSVLHLTVFLERLVERVAGIASWSPQLLSFLVSGFDAAGSKAGERWKTLWEGSA